MASLWIAECGLHGPLPSAYSVQMPNIWQLSLGNNRLTGDFCTSLPVGLPQLWGAPAASPDIGLATVGPLQLLQWSLCLQ